MKLYQIDYKRLLLLLLPTFLRKPVMVALGMSLTVSVSKLYDKFIEHRRKVGRLIQYNGQVCYLRALLNDELDNEKRRITIADSAIDDYVLAYNEDRERQLFVRDEADKAVILYDESAIRGRAGVFVVSVPWASAEVNKMNRVRDLLNEYKLAGCRYIVINNEN